MKTLKGTSAASGIALGTVCLYVSEVEKNIPHYSIAAEHVPAELERLSAAFAAAKNEMEHMIRFAGAQMDKKAVDIFTTHLMMLGDKSLNAGIADLINGRLINAEHAVSDVFEKYIRRYEKEEGHFRELTHDFIDTRDRLLNALVREEGGFKCDVGDHKPVIVAARRLTPSMVLRIPKEHVLAFVTDEGGFTSHATILARSYGVPIIFGIDVEHELDCGMEVVVDGSLGKVVVAPDAGTAEYYRQKIENIARKKNVCLVNRDDAARMQDGRRVTLKVNISTPAEIDVIASLPHDGIGLLRTEFIFMERNTPPTEEEQYAVYRKLLRAAGDKPVTVRLLDVAADKMPSFLQLQEGADPDMELRGAMAVETFPELYVTQVRALLRANEAGNLRLMFPMVSDLNDLRTFRGVLAEARAQLFREQVPHNDRFSQGVMIETPAAVMMVDELLAEVDFINIGSNDLLQYTLAAARGSRLAERRYHILHPALLKLLRIVAAAGKQAGKDVCLCGEIAAFEEYYPLLLQAGIESFSVAVSKFNDIKCELLYQHNDGDRQLLEDFYRTATKEDADRFLSRFV